MLTTTSVTSVKKRTADYKDQLTDLFKFYYAQDPTADDDKEPTCYTQECGAGREDYNQPECKDNFYDDIEAIVD